METKILFFSEDYKKNMVVKASASVVEYFKKHGFLNDWFDAGLLSTRLSDEYRIAICERFGSCNPVKAVLID